MSSAFPQRRDAFRVGLSGRARVRRALGELAEFELRDLSVGGARLIGFKPPDLEESITLEIGLHDGEVVTVEGRVVRLDAHGCGVRFTALPAAVENRISRFVTDEQRRRGRSRA